MLTEGKAWYDIPAHKLAIGSGFPLTKMPSVQFFFFLVIPGGNMGQREPVPTSAPCRMDGKWLRNSFLLGFQFPS
jgi:hypothetical protein